MPSPSLFILVRDAEDDELSMQKNHLALVKELQKEKPERKLYCPLLCDLTQAEELLLFLMQKMCVWFHSYQNIKSLESPMW